MRNKTGRHSTIDMSSCCLLSSPGHSSDVLERADKSHLQAGLSVPLSPVKKTYLCNPDAAEVASHHMRLSARWHTVASSHTCTHLHPQMPMRTRGCVSGMITPKKHKRIPSIALRTADRGHSTHTIAPAFIAPLNRHKW